MNPSKHDLWTGTLYALTAGAVWGLVFVIPLLLPQYPAAWLSVGRYLAFGLIALPLAWLDRRALAELTRGDWWVALQLAAVGNLLYYLCLAASIQRSGAPLPTMMIGTLPVVIALCSNWRASSGRGGDGHLPWSRLGPSLLMIGLGIALVNHVEMQHVRAQNAAGVDWWRYGSGVVLAGAAVACWTWYPIHNADWLRQHPSCNPRSWATAQGVATLPLALLGAVVLYGLNQGNAAALPWPGGPTPERFALLMLASGLLASWVGTLCWNKASQRLPTHLAGQLIVFETLAALTYSLIFRGQTPHLFTLSGMALLVVGVLWALRAQGASRQGAAPAAHDGKPADVCAH